MEAELRKELQEFRDEILALRIKVAVLEESRSGIDNRVRLLIAEEMLKWEREQRQYERERLLKEIERTQADVDRLQAERDAARRDRPAST